MPELPDPVSESSRPGLIGNRILRYRTVDSTNDVAKLLLDGGLREGGIVVAERQTAGRGRNGRSWASPTGGLYVSIVLTAEPTAVGALSLVAGIPVVQALRHFGVFAGLKWPNDVVFMDKKIGGILGEGVYRGEGFWVVMGMGVNTNLDLEDLPAKIRETATSLRHEVDLFVSNEEFLDFLLGRFEDLYRRFKMGTGDRLLKEYRGLCATIGKDVTMATPKGKVNGRAWDITLSGTLIVMDGAGKKHEVLDPGDLV